MRRDTKKLKAEAERETLNRKKTDWRKGSSIQRVKKPSKPERARELGYKAKQGVVVVRARVRRGGRRKSRPSLGRRPKRLGVKKITPKKSIQTISEERVARKYPNLEVLNSYKVGEDGQHHYYEVILLDPNHPSIQKDPNFEWITSPSQKGRAHRGLTSSNKQ